VNKSGVKTKTQKQVETNKYNTNKSGVKIKIQKQVETNKYQTDTWLV